MIERFQTPWTYRDAYGSSISSVVLILGCLLIIEDAIWFACTSYNPGLGLTRAKASGMEKGLSPVHEPLAGSEVVNDRVGEDTVVIAGGGPVGLILATVLARYGLKSIVLERNESTTK